MLIALIGPDRYLVGQSLHRYVPKYVPEASGLGDLNLTRLDGARLLPDELARAVQAMGFLADTRLVIVEGLLSRFGGKAADSDGTASDKADLPTRGRAKADPGLTEGFAQLFADVP